MTTQLSENQAQPTAAHAAPWVFQGSSAAGVIRLELPRALDAEGAVTGAEQVLRLAQAEPLIQAVEQWLQGPWDPMPLAAPTERAEPAGYRAVVRDPALAPPGTVLSLPRSALMTPPPTALRAPALTWEAQAATLVLDAIAADALASLEPGALLWLPAAFGPDWAVQLRDPMEQLTPRTARLELAAQRLTVSPMAAGVTAPGREPVAPDTLQVVLARPVPLPLDHWLGWANAGAPWHWPLPQPWAAELRQGSTLLARGALLPVGAGCGLRIEALAADAVARPA